MADRNLDPDVVRLVLAARAVAYDTDGPTQEAIRELDLAAEAFAECVGWSDKPDAASAFTRSQS